MEPRLQLRVQRYGWDLAVDDYERLWQGRLAVAHDALIEAAAIASGERVVDIACGTGLVAFEVAGRVGRTGHVVGLDLSSRMVDAARSRATARGVSNISFARMDAQRLDLPDASFDVASCALGLMYVPDPLQAAREAARVLRPGGRFAVAVWGRRSHCAWSSVFDVVDAEVASEVCPLFFGLGERDALALLCIEAGFVVVESRRIATTLMYADADEVCEAAFVGGPVALAWSRFDPAVRARVRARYLATLAPWRSGGRYAIPAEFVVAAGVRKSIG